MIPEKINNNSKYPVISALLGDTVIGIWHENDKDFQQNDSYYDLLKIYSESPRLILNIAKTPVEGKLHIFQSMRKTERTIFIK